MIAKWTLENIDEYIFEKISCSDLFFYWYIRSYDEFR